MYLAVFVDFANPILEFVWDFLGCGRKPDIVTSSEALGGPFGGLWGALVRPSERWPPPPPDQRAGWCPTCYN